MLKNINGIELIWFMGRDGAGDAFFNVLNCWKGIMSKTIENGA